MWCVCEGGSERAPVRVPACAALLGHALLAMAVTLLSISGRLAGAAPGEGSASVGVVVALSLPAPPPPPALLPPGF